LTLPPAQCGDVLRVLRLNPSTIVLIDGVYERVAAVWHKEILHALACGVRVIGAASMGALRAAELAPYGMEGLGSIYEDYASGVLVDDDEVAIVHTSDGEPLSEPLVNIRATLRHAVEAGVVGCEVAGLVEAEAKGTFYAERSLSDAIRRARERSGDPAQFAPLHAFIADGGRVDQKRKDAITALKAVGMSAKRRSAQYADAPTTGFLRALVRDVANSALPVYLDAFPLPERIVSAARFLGPAYADAKLVGMFLAGMTDLAKLMGAEPSYHDDGLVTSDCPADVAERARLVDGYAAAILGSASVADSLRGGYLADLLRLEGLYPECRRHGTGLVHALGDMAPDRLASLTLAAHLWRLFDRVAMGHELVPRAGELQSEIDQFRGARGLSEPWSMHAWLDENELDDEAFVQLMVSWLRVTTTILQSNMGIFGVDSVLDDVWWLRDALWLTGLYPKAVRLDRTTAIVPTDERTAFARDFRGGAEGAQLEYGRIPPCTRTVAAVDADTSAAAFFNERVRQLGPTPEALAFDNAASQKLRFDAFLQIARVEPGDSILDIGCGFADLHGFLQARRIDVVYHGWDVSAEALSVADQRYPDLAGRLFLHDVRRSDHANNTNNQYDWTFCSGTFNIGFSVAESMALLGKLFAMARKGYVGCYQNADGTLGDQACDGYERASFRPDELYRHARELSRWVVLRADYAAHDIAVGILRTPSGGGGVEDRPSGGLATFLHDVSASVDLQHMFRDDPELTMDRYGLAEADRAGARGDDRDRVQRAFERVTPRNRRFRSLATSSSTARPSLTVVGTGIRCLADMPRGTVDHVVGADQVFFGPTHPWLSAWLRIRRPDAENLLRGSSGETVKLVQYHRMVQRVVQSVVRGHRVCVVFGGHPGFFVKPAHSMVRAVRDAGFDAQMLPAPSSLDWLFVDLVIDPAEGGLRIHDATDWLVRDRVRDITTDLVLLQAGLLHAVRYEQDNDDNRAGLRLLQDALRTSYGSGHAIMAYESATFPTWSPRMDEMCIADLTENRVLPETTLFVPRLMEPPTSANRRKQLERVRTTPGPDPV